jgi:hypothetical protein
LLEASRLFYLFREAILRQAKGRDASSKKTKEPLSLKKVIQVKRVARGNEILEI